MPNLKKIQILDTTLRDGAQAEDIAFSLADKLHIARLLDKFGVSYIEGGNPSANPKDLLFFQAAAVELRLKNAKLCAFGSTRRKNTVAKNDEHLNTLLAAKTPTVVIFGKAWDLHVHEILQTTLAENLSMIADSIKFCQQQKREVIFDAEHFFAGYHANAEYAESVIKTAISAGAEIITLCDTNGGFLPLQIYEITRAMVEKFAPTKFAIHAHNDSACAVANSLVAVSAGAVQIQGTFIGFGERCGNADLISIIANLQLKEQCLCAGDLTKLSATARAIAEILNVKIDDRHPYIGKSAFAHKAGMHIDGVLKNPTSFEHIAPETIGNRRRFLVSEFSGCATIIEKIKLFAPRLSKKSPALAKILTALKNQELQGYQYEAADASFELLVRKILGTFEKHFSLTMYKTIGEFPAPRDTLPASAMITVEVDGENEMTSAAGTGPVNALDLALRKALTVFYPQIAEVHLIDYKVRVLDADAATAAKVRVLIESTDGARIWTTIGVSTDIIEASLLALVDSLEYKLSLK